MIGERFELKCLLLPLVPMTTPACGRRKYPGDSLVRARSKRKWLFGPSRACGPGRSAGTVPSAPVVGCCRLQASRERVVAGQCAVCDWDLAPARDAELLTE